jgi:hypothetical protein
MDATRLIEQFWKELEWLAFYTQYCAGENIDKPICGDFRFWTIGAAAGVGVLVIAIVVSRIAGKVRDSFENWRQRKALAAVADAETMEKHKWVGDRVSDVQMSREELAAEFRKAIKSGKSSPDEGASSMTKGKS